MPRKHVVKFALGLALIAALLYALYARHPGGNERPDRVGTGEKELFEGIDEPNIFKNKFWTKEAELQGPDGYTYYFMDFSIMQGQEMLLVRTKNPKNPEKMYEELGWNNGDSPRSWASVIRPAGAPDNDYGQLYLSRAGMLLGIRYDNHCFFAYDTKTRKFYGHGDVETISPFLLIEAETELHEPDVLGMLYEVVEDTHYAAEYPRRPRDFSPGCPRPATLEEGTKHPNRSARDISQWCLKIQELGLSTADEDVHAIIDYLIARLKVENPKSRVAAAAALGYFKTPHAYEAIPHLEAVIRSNAPGVAAKAAQSLGQMGEAAFPLLRTFLGSEDSSVRFRGLYGFRIAGVRARAHAKDILPLLDDESAGVRRQALTALDSMKYYEQDLIPYLEKLTKDEDKWVQRDATNMLAKVNK